MIDKGQWGEFGQDTGVTPLLFTRSAMFLFYYHRESKKFNKRKVQQNISTNVSTKQLRKENLSIYINVLIITKINFKNKGHSSLLRSYGIYFRNTWIILCFVLLMES